MRTGGYNGRRKGGCSLENRGTVRSVAKAMELLQLLSERGEPLSLTEIARMQELPKSTAFGLLNTLREYEMVSQGRDGRYSLGIRLFEYGCRVSRAWDVPRLARPYLEQLAAQVNVSAVLSIREGDRVMTLDQVEGAGELLLPRVQRRRTLAEHALPAGGLERIDQLVLVHPLLP